MSRTEPLTRGTQDSREALKCKPLTSGPPEPPQPLHAAPHAHVLVNQSLMGLRPSPCLCTGAYQSLHAAPYAYILALRFLARTRSHCSISPASPVQNQSPTPHIRTSKPITRLLTRGPQAIMTSISARSTPFSHWGVHTYTRHAGHIQPTFHRMFL